MRISTSKLLGLLGDLVLTAGTDPDVPGINTVLLHTTRGHHGAEPGLVELLAGASTNRFVAAHSYVPCVGQWAAPSLWRVRDIKSVITVFKAARGKDKHDLHAVDVTRSGGEVTIREDPNLVDDGVHLSFAELDATEFPARSVYERILDAEQPAALPVTDPETGTLSFVDAVPATTLSADVLAPFLKVAKRRSGVLRVYRTHQHVPLLVQIGEDYRGTLMPVRTNDGMGSADPQRPDAPLYPPDLAELQDPVWMSEAAETDAEDESSAPQLRLVEEEMR